MAGNVLAVHVHVRKPNREVVVLEPGQELPAWAKDLVTNPKVFRDAPAAATEQDSSPDAGTPSTPASTGYDALKGEELKAELKRRELPQTGNKPELIARLEKDDAERAALDAGSVAEGDDSSDGEDGGAPDGGAPDENPAGDEE